MKPDKILCVLDMQTKNLNCMKAKSHQADLQC